MRADEIRELQDQRRSLADQAGEILAASKREAREMTAEENERFDKLHDECSKLLQRIERSEMQRQVEEDLSQRAASRETMAALTPGNDAERRDAKTKAYDDAFRSWLQHGMGGLTVEQRGLIGEKRAQGTTPDTAGGYTVGISQDFQGTLEVALKAFGGVRTAARVITTSSGSDLPWPTSDDTFQEGELLAENTATVEQDVLFGEIVLSSYQYSSKSVRVSAALLNDSSIPFESELAMMLATRIGRITNRHMTTGTGTGEPEGIVTAAGDGVTLATLGVITWDELLDLEHSVDPAYRANPSAGWMMSDEVLKAVKKLVDQDGRPLWQPAASASIGNVRQDTIDGYPVYINQEMAGIETGDVSMLFGDYSKFIIRDVADSQIMRLTERWAEYRQVGFIHWSRHDSRALFAQDATNSPNMEPIKKMVQP